jgi:putative ABC transport system ATP-binding protein
MRAPALVVIDTLSHCYGEGMLRQQILFDVVTEVRAREIAIVTGPSGSGKTTLLTLIGALRSTQAGSLRVLGQELRGADEATLIDVRRRIGYVFQDHNLLEFLSAEQNVRMGLRGTPLSREEARERACEVLRLVGLLEHADHRPRQLSTGQRQRVAVARALVHRPQLVLADEPTASLDRRSQRVVVHLLLGFAREQGAAVVLVTHDPRILDVADRIVHLEDGRLAAVRQRHDTALVPDQGEGLRRVDDLPPAAARRYGGRERVASSAPRGF